MSSFSVIFDVALGLILLYLVLSVTASALSEAISNLLNWRAKLLEKFITQLLKDSEISVDAFYNDTLLQTQSLDQAGMFSNTTTRQRPAYLRADDFSQAIMDSLRKEYPPRTDTVASMSSMLSMDDWKAIVGQMKADSPLRTVMLAMLSRTERMVATAEANIGAQSTTLHDSLNDWYDASMQRVAGWYKARIQITLLIIGIGISAVLNIDTITITDSLLQNPAVRSAVEATAATVSSASDPKLLGYLNQLAIPLGWNTSFFAAITVSTVALKLVGILITGFAVSQGAPFWFDLLNRVTNLRSSGRAPSTQSSDSVGIFPTPPISTPAAAIPPSAIVQPKPATPAVPTPATAPTPPSPIVPADSSQQAVG